MIHAVNYIASSVSDICKDVRQTYLAQGMWWVADVCLFVCLFVCLTIAQRQVNLEEEKVVPY